MCIPIDHFYSFATSNLQKDRKLKPYPLNQIHDSKLDLALGYFLVILVLFNSDIKTFTLGTVRNFVTHHMVPVHIRVSNF
jgi:hypothetical protein